MQIEKIELIHHGTILFENMVLMLAEQTGGSNEQLIRKLFKSGLYSDLVNGVVDITAITPESAMDRLKAEEFV